MTKSVREVIESPVKQGVRESVAYRFDYSELGTPATPTAKVWEEGTAWTDVTATKLVGVASISGQGILSPLLTGLEAGHVYLLYVEGMVSGNVLGKFCKILAEFP